MVYYQRVDPRVLILAIPSLVVLGLLVFHSFRTMERRRALAFWASVTAYGIVRGVALAWVISHGGASSFPYTIRHPLFPVFGVPLQELAGWGIVAYLGWWLGARLSGHLFAQVAWACLFLAAVSWTVESAAVAAGWWFWTVPVNQPLLINVPSIAIVDWLFVGIDFLLPFAVITAPSLRDRPARYLSLGAFPLHFGSHCFSGEALGSLPIPPHHLVHWILLAGVLCLALRSDVSDAPFERESVDRRLVGLPFLGLAVIVLDVVAVELFLLRQAELLVAVVPTIAAALLVFHPGFRSTVAGALAWCRRTPRYVPVVLMVVLAITAYTLHSGAARRQAELMRRLASALADRDRGDLDAARSELTVLCAEFPGSHAPPALLGEIDYRTNRLEQARDDFQRAVRTKQDYVKGYRYLAVIDLRAGNKESAARFANRGLAIDAEDPELRYLAAQARASRDFPASATLRDPASTIALSALAFEVGDVEGAALFLDRGLGRWPDERALYPTRVRLALEAGDRTTARRVVASWLERFPQDAEAGRLAQLLGTS